MKEFIVTGAEEGLSLFRFVSRILSEAPSGVIYKALRKKNIDLNGSRASGRETLRKGDRVAVWFSDDTFALYHREGPEEEKKAEKKGEADRDSGNMARRFREMILYEDSHVILVNKPAGLLTQSDETGEISLNDLLIAYYESRERPSEAVFRPSVCNRLDRNTSGIVLCGVSVRGLQEMHRILKDRLIQKTYRTVVCGSLESAGVLMGRLVKDGKRNLVRILPGGKNGVPVETIYEPLNVFYAGDTVLTELSVKPVTGKPHQIRAHLSSAGYPILGDLKYGTPQSRKASRELKAGRQLLHAEEVAFPELSDGLSDLSYRTFRADLPQDMERILNFRGKQAFFLRRGKA